MRFGSARDKVALTNVDPVVVAEVLADSALQGGQYRHPLRFVRIRMDLAPATSLSTRARGGGPQRPIGEFVVARMLHESSMKKAPGLHLCTSGANQTVGVTGFEPAASSSRTTRATKLRHTPWQCCRPEGRGDTRG